MLWLISKIIDTRVAGFAAGESLCSAKAARIRFRRNALKELIREHRSDLLHEVFQVDASSGACLSDTAVESEIFDSSVFDMLSNTIRLINPMYEGEDVEHSDVLIFDDIEGAVDSVLEGADDRFGEMAGIDQNETYNKFSDPFTVNLQK
tara:strand:- start:25815 stop:26261 length:447 start_codon:yes stop_codon:yes gene_type:complete